jgi:TfoX/Sxy family transcriptional regulator of competence genes
MHMPREMPSFDKSPAELVDRFHAFVATRDDLEPRQMFGYPSAFVGGNLATGLHKATWFVRLPADDEGTLRDLGGGSFEPMPGRPMRGYVTMPDAVLDDPTQLSAWVDRAVAFVRTLPVKGAKAAKPAKGR